LILDTNALSALADGEPSLRGIIAGSSGPYVPVIVLGEYHFGVLESRHRESRLRWLAELMRYWQVLDISTETAVAYAHIRGQLKRSAAPIPSNDVWIASLAVQHELPLLSDDAHFDLVDGVRRISWT
jgi:predicted nucleic acid-binding protein